MRIVYFESREEDERILRPLLREHAVRWIDEPASLESAAEHAADADSVSVSIRGSLSRRVLAAMPALRFVATRSISADHVDLAACRERGIRVSNVPEYGEGTVAEHTFGLLLALTRRIVVACERTRRRAFALEGLEGIDLCGRALGIVGLGRIGARVATVARAFGMGVLASDPAPHAALAERLGVTYAPLAQLLAQADVVTIHASLDAASHHLLDDRAFEQMRHGALLINTARGEIVDTGALLRALDRGTLAGAGLDVLEGEEAIREEAELLARSPSPERGRALLETHGLLQRPNVIVTPHIGFYSREAIERILRVTADNLLAFAAGQVRNRLA